MPAGGIRESLEGCRLRPPASGQGHTFPGSPFLRSMRSRPLRAPLGPVGWGSWRRVFALTCGYRIRVAASLGAVRWGSLWQAPPRPCDPIDMIGDRVVSASS
jgi:hypothetical protein